MNAVKAIIFTLLMLMTSLAGCLDGPGRIGGQGDTSEEDLALPAWEVGDFWLYSFQTPQFGEDSARLVVAEVNEDEQQYMLGISSDRESKRHAVINHNPFLGRVTFDGLSVFENGEPQPVFNFPWEKGSEWQFTLLGQEWTAEVENIYNGKITVQASSSESHSLSYTFSGAAGFISELVWANENGAEQLRMSLAQNGNGHTGDVYFHRATDLKDSYYESSDSDVYDSFFDSGHPSGADFDQLVWYLDVEISQGGSGSLTMKDHAGASPLTRYWGSGAEEDGTIGTIPSNSNEYSLTITLRGQESFIHLKVAGVITHEWTL